MDKPAGPVHGFYAAAFVENLSLKDLAVAYPDARRRAHELFYRVDRPLRPVLERIHLAASRVRMLRWQNSAHRQSTLPSHVPSTHAPSLD